MLALTVTQSLLTFLFVVVCVLLILLILIQKGRGGGLSGAFGGVGSYSPFGTKTGDALTWATVILTGMYLLIAVLANYAYRPVSLSSLGSAVTTPAGQAQPIDAGDQSGGDTATASAPANQGASQAAPADAEKPAPAAVPASPATQPAK